VGIPQEELYRPCYLDTGTEDCSDRVGSATTMYTVKSLAHLTAGMCILAEQAIYIAPVSELTENGCKGAGSAD